MPDRVTVTPDSAEYRARTRHAYAVLCGEHISFKGRLKCGNPPSSKIGRKIGMFSKASRFRMIKFLCEIDYTRLPKSLFVTLTYPDVYSGRNHKERTIDRHSFMRKIEREFMLKIPGLWRLEWQPRKSGKNVGLLMPHYHLVFMGIDYLPYEFINRFWQETLHWDGYIRTEVQGCTSEQAAIWYVAKYAAKVEDLSSLVYGLQLNTVDGRHYGYLRKALIPKCLKEHLRLNEKQAEYLIQIAKERRGDYAFDPDLSFTLLGSLTQEQRRILLSLAVDNGEGS